MWWIGFNNHIITSSQTRVFYLPHSIHWTVMLSNKEHVTHLPALWMMPGARSINLKDNDFLTKYYISVYSTTKHLLGQDNTWNCTNHHHYCLLLYFIMGLSPGLKLILLEWSCECLYLSAPGCPPIVSSAQ